MKGLLVLFMAVSLVSVWSLAGADEADIRRELEVLKKRIEELEAKLQERKPQEEGYEEVKAQVGGLREVIMERLGTLSIHGGVVGYYQGTSEPRIGGNDFKNPDGAGYVADLELTFEPVKNGAFFLRLHAGEGNGADTHLEPGGALFADLNTINDDNPDGQFMDVLEAFYTHNFFDGKLFVSVGKTEPVVFVDDNALANCEYTQFVGKPFVNDPVLDSEDEFGPLLAIGFSPLEGLSLVALAQSSSHGETKDIWDDIFERPFFAGQVTYSPKIDGLEGHYRLYGWGATYDHAELTRLGDSQGGWGLGLSVDQQVAQNVGLFGRLGYHNDEVYPVDWFWSVGASFKGLIPKRCDDVFGIGVAGLHANEDLDKLPPDYETELLLSGDNDDTEYHFEAYYRIALSRYFALTPDVQYVLNPLGNTDNDGVFAGMIRGEFGF